MSSAKWRPFCFGLDVLIRYFWFYRSVPSVVRVLCVRAMVLVYMSVCAAEDADSVVQLRGAGASFPSSVYYRWLPAYKVIAIQCTKTPTAMLAPYDGIKLGQTWVHAMACCLTAPIHYMNQSVRSGSDIQLKLMVVLFSIQLNSNKRCREHLSTHWGRVAHICVDNLTTIGSDNGLSPGRRQAIIWTNAGILLFGPLGSKQWNLNRNWYI